MCRAAPSYRRNSSRLLYSNVASSCFSSIPSPAEVWCPSRDPRLFYVCVPHSIISYVDFVSQPRSATSPNLFAVAIAFSSVTVGPWLQRYKEYHLGFATTTAIITSGNTLAFNGSSSGAFGRCLGACFERFSFIEVQGSAVSFDQGLFRPISSLDLRSYFTQMEGAS